MTSAVEDRGTAERRPLKVDVDPEYRRRIKVRAAEAGVTMRQYILEALELGLEAQAREAGKKRR